MTRSAAPAPVDGPTPLPAGTGMGLPFDPTWCLVVGDDREGTGPADDAGLATVVESWCCLADGTVGTRGVLEDESGGDHPPGPAVVAAGLYEPAEGVSETLVPLPSWCALPVAGSLRTGRRVLDLRDGVLTRRAAGGGGGGELWSARFACAERPGTGVLVAEVAAELLTGGPVGGGCRVGGPDEGGPAGSSAGQAGEGAVPRRWRSPFGGGALVATDTRVTPEARSGGPVTVERLAVHVVSAHRAPRRAEASRRLARARELGPAALLAEQRRAWGKRWAAADVEIVGDPELTLAVRFSLFHLLSSAARRGEAAVGARGLTGPAYAGHVFWDTDVFVLPVLAAVAPRQARAVLEYRLRRLDAARARAGGNGRRGARFPWESAHDGRDVTPRSGVDQHGTQVPIRTGDLEEHVTADVAWGAWRYAAWTGDWSFLTGPAYPLLVETARYWAARVRRDAQGAAHIDHVIGPDEYHEDVDDNAFTNLMARWNLRRAAELVERVGPRGSEADEAGGWRETADALVDGYDRATGRYEQFAGYDRLAPVMAADLGAPPLAADLVLGPERLAATQVVKQADVLMAHFLVPGETEPGSLDANLRHYLSRCAHGSSLSPSVHATLLARDGRPDEALDLLAVAVAVDLEDLTETTGGGLHLANLGGIWQAVVHGFAGVAVERPDDPALVIEPHLPGGWDELKVTVGWHGAELHLTCRRDGVHVSSPVALTVRVHGTVARIEPPGRWVG